LNLFIWVLSAAKPYQQAEVSLAADGISVQLKVGGKMTSFPNEFKVAFWVKQFVPLS